MLVDLLIEGGLNTFFTKLGFRSFNVLNTSLHSTLQMFAKRLTKTNAIIV